MVRKTLETSTTGEKSKKQILTGRRNLMMKGIASFVLSGIQARVLAQDIPPVELETEFVEGITKAEIGGELMDLPDEEIEKMDPDKPTVGRARALAQRALGKVSQILVKIRR